MNVAKQNPFVQRLVDHPYDHEALFAAYQATAKDPGAYCSLLVEAASRTSEHVAASHWLTEAARVQAQVLRDEKGTLRLLEAALERDPLNLRAAEQIVDFYRSRNDDEELSRVLRARSTTLRARCSENPVELPRAAQAFEKLSGAFEAIGDSNAAISALRTALELERAHSRNTTPSPPPDAPAPSAPRIRTARVDSEEPRVPPPERSVSRAPGSEPRDTVRSSLPALAPKHSGPPTAPPERVVPADPLLAVVEALHALRRSDDVVEGAALVLRTALSAIPCAAGFVHVCDLATRDFVVVAASGPEQAEIVGTRASENDPWLGRAMREMEAVAVDAGDTRLTGTRFGVVRPLHAVLCSPVQFDGRALGAIELVDPTLAEQFTLADRNAMTYVGERFAEFLAERSIAF
jgi:hypothetical protein